MNIMISTCMISLLNSKTEGLKYSSLFLLAIFVNNDDHSVFYSAAELKIMSKSHLKASQMLLRIKFSYNFLKINKRWSVTSVTNLNSNRLLSLCAAQWKPILWHFGASQEYWLLHHPFVMIHLRCNISQWSLNRKVYPYYIIRSYVWKIFTQISCASSWLSRLRICW